MTMMSRWACPKCGTVSPPNRPSACACLGNVAAAPPSTPVSLPSEEEFCEFWAWEIDELDFNTLPETDKDRVDGLGACKDDYREDYRAIRKLLTDKGVG